MFSYGTTSWASCLHLSPRHSVVDIKKQTKVSTKMVANETFKPAFRSLRQPQIKNKTRTRNKLLLNYVRKGIFLLLSLFLAFWPDTLFFVFLFSFGKNLNCSYMFSDIKFNETKSRNKPSRWRAQFRFGSNN